MPRTSAGPRGVTHVGGASESGARSRTLTSPEGGDTRCSEAPRRLVRFARDATRSPRRRSARAFRARATQRRPASRHRLRDGVVHGADAELGWQVRGVEIDAGAVETARGIGLAVRQGTMADVDPEIDGIFDHVTVGHVIEHVHDPLEALRATHRVLRPGGRLWIGTPNLGSSRIPVVPFELACPRASASPRALHPQVVDARAAESRFRRRQARASHGIRAMAPRVERASWPESARRRRLPMAAMAVNAVSYARPGLSDEMTVIAYPPVAARSLARSRDDLVGHGAVNARGRARCSRLLRPRLRA